MSNASSMKLPVWFWAVAIIALLWNLMGVYAYWADVTMTPETIAKYPPAQQEMFNERPSWLIGAYAIAVFVGLLATISLLLRKAFAVPLYAVSLAAVVIQMGYVLFVMNAIGKLGLSAAIFPSVIVILGAAELWFSRMTKAKGWIG